MTTAPKAFQKAVREKKAEERPVVEFVLKWVDDEDTEKVIREDTFHAQKPTDERMFLLAALSGDEDAGPTAQAAATLDVFRAALPEDEFRTLRHRLGDPEDDLDLEMLQDVFMWLMGEWSSFPTQPSSDSPTSRPSTGGRSTGRVRGPASTRST